ncbi:MAG TPA: hypothetical protein EYP22_04765 [Methanosarcinales archaeon]|nr:hypothetical protein [Methanosarcinales archaeon]
MPEFATVFAGNLVSQWEVTPSVGRNLNFLLTTRDNRADGGQTDSDNVLITVSDTSGPFTVTSHTTDEIWEAGETKTITWNVAGTTTSGINVANVEIVLVDSEGDILSVLVASTENDGSQDITVPEIVNPSTKVMVKAIDNIFYLSRALRPLYLMEIFYGKRKSIFSWLWTWRSRITYSKSQEID